MNGIFKRPEEFGSGTKLVNVYDLYPDSQIDTTQLERVITDSEELGKYQVVLGDVFFTRSSLKPEGVAWTSFVSELDEPTIFECHLIRARTNQDKILPAFLSYYGRSSLARRYLLAKASVTTMATIDQTSISTFPILLPPISTQRALVAEMQAARESRNQKLAQADALLKGIDDFVLRELGLQNPPTQTRVVYGARLKDLRATKHLNSDYFHPERINALRVIQSGLRSARLAEFVHFVRESIAPSPEMFYVGLGNVQSNTGEFVETGEQVEGQVMKFKQNDVLFGRLRPYLNKVYRAERDGVCSGEFHVIRPNRETELGRELQPDYLAAILRSSLILTQTKHMMTGNTHPRLTNEDVVNLVMPLPDKTTQAHITREIQHRQTQARRLRAQAETEWQAAKKRFEEQLLGE